MYNLVLSLKNQGLKSSFLNFSTKLSTVFVEKFTSSRNTVHGGLFWVFVDVGVIFLIDFL